MYIFNDCDPWNTINHAKSHKYNNYWKIFTTYDQIYSTYNQDDVDEIDFLKIVNKQGHTQRLEFGAFS